MRTNDRVLAVFVAAFTLSVGGRAFGGDVKILYWYDRTRPLDTFKFTGL